MQGYCSFIQKVEIKMPAELVTRQSTPEQTCTSLAPNHLKQRKVEALERIKWHTLMLQIPVDLSIIFVSLFLTFSK